MPAEKPPDPGPAPSPAERLRLARRQAVSGEVARVQARAGTVPLVTPQVDGVDLVAWAAANVALIERELHASGGLRLRGFRLPDVAAFEAFARAASGGRELLEYTYRSTPRTRLEGRVYTSTEYPPSQAIPLHNENAYSRDWPARLFFWCVQPAVRGGATPVADSRRVYQRIDPAVRERFSERGVLYVRNYGGLDLPWQEVFQTEDRGEVERFCGGAGIECEWSEEGLRTRQRCQGVARHPVTGELVWFNQAHLFHVSALEPQTRASLLELLPEERLPRHAYYGDGSPIEEQALEHVRAAYRETAVSEPWQAGELLVVDNLLMAHGREPYEGPRRVLVAMT